MKNQLYNKQERMNFKGILLTEEQIKLINRRTPESEVTIKIDEGGNEYKSVKASYIKKMLNLIFDFDYDFEIITKEYFAASKEVLVHGKLTFRSNGKTSLKEQFGGFRTVTQTETSGSRTTTAPLNLVSCFKAAATDALKKCASEIGLCWDIYGHDKPEPKQKDLLINAANNDELKISERLIHFLSRTDNKDSFDSVIETFKESEEITPYIQSVIDYQREIRLNK